MAPPPIEALTKSEYLRLLYEANTQNGNNPRRIKCMEELGYRDPSLLFTKIERREGSELHARIRETFMSRTETAALDDAQVMEILKREGDNLRSLFAQDLQQEYLLHRLLNLKALKHDFSDLSIESILQKLKPLLRFLLVIMPESLNQWNSDGQAPLYVAIGNEDVGPLIRFLCGDGEKTHSWSERAIKSLAMTGPGGPFTHTYQGFFAQQGYGKTNALHKAVDSEVELDERILGSETLRPYLTMLDKDGLTCLHRAVTPPETAKKREWAEILVKIDNTLLEAKNCHGLTPLQYLIDKSTEAVMIKQGDRIPENDTNIPNVREAKSDDRRSMVTWLKLCCLTGDFTNATARSIMYKSDKSLFIQRQQTRDWKRYDANMAPVLQIDFSGLERGDVVSIESLSNSNKHYKLDRTLLRMVFIPQVTAKWDRHSKEVEREVKSWNCVGRVDYYLIFHWLKKVVGVKEVLNVIVEDLAGNPHSDAAIYHCLKELSVNTWNWKKMDISSAVIETAAATAREVYLYCSGNNAVLRGWSDSNGLIRLTKLEKVHLELNQGLESFDTVEDHYVKEFEIALKKRFRDIYQRTIEVKHKINKHMPEKPDENSRATKPKERGEEGYEEQEWLKCMDEFADFVDLTDALNKDAKPVKVAIIDDGVKSNYDNLDNNIDDGESWVRSGPQQPHSPYFTSVKGHGTVMAYLIRRVCPQVRLYVLKLDPTIVGGYATFSMESATQAIQWAVRKEVDIISMSWSIDPISEKDGKEDPKVEALRLAIQNSKALLFCAWPDKGAGFVKKTYPLAFADGRIFSIGAATRDGNPAPKVGDGKPDFFLPGVELGIPVHTKTNERLGERPPETYVTYSGSSLSCALAAGLAAMILHCVRKVDSKHSQSLMSYDGMKRAFESIHMSHHRWLAVGSFFRHQLITQASGTERQRILTTITNAFFSRMDLEHRL